MWDAVDREEIRWKFQIMLENIGSSIDRAENKRKLLDENFIRTENRIIKPRNQRLGGMGFIITTIVALISTKTVETFCAPTCAKSFEHQLIQMALILGFGGLAYYYYTEFLIKKESRKNDDVNITCYTTMSKTLIPLKGMISTLALQDDITKEKMDTIMKYVSTYAKSVDYVLTLSLVEKIGGEDESDEKFDHEQYRVTYEKAKTSLDEFKSYNFSLGTEVIEKFIGTFEKYNHLKME